ncbi:MAG: hypothetical protein EHM41_00045 [Chloroflexi bacterium]|nr:MAG: hypothetical protein EHM41_00045 [Chloroflexota bacterium]
MAVAFTNKPELAGTEAAPGVVYQYVDASKPVEAATQIGAETVGGVINKPLSTEDTAQFTKFGPRPAETVNAPVTAPVSEPLPATDTSKITYGPHKAYVEAQDAQRTEAAATSQATLPKQMPVNAYVIKGTAEERQGFEQQILNDVFDGINPHMVDTEVVVQKKVQDAIPAEFERFFKGSVRWQSREQLDPEQQKQWNKHYLAWEAKKAKKVEDDFKGLTTKYDYLMGEYDKQATVAVAASKTQKEADAAKQKAPDTKDILNTETGDTELGYYNPETGLYESKGQVTKKGTVAKTPTVSEIKTVEEATTKLFTEKANSETGQVPESDLEAINLMRTKIGLQPYREVIKAEPVKEGFMGRYLPRGVEGKIKQTYTYEKLPKKETKAATPQATPQAAATTTPTQDQGMQLSIIGTAKDKAGAQVSIGEGPDGKIYWVDAQGNGGEIAGATRESFLGGKGTK